MSVDMFKDHGGTLMAYGQSWSNVIGALHFKEFVRCIYNCLPPAHLELLTARGHVQNSQGVRSVTHPYPADECVLRKYFT